MLFQRQRRIWSSCKNFNQHHPFSSSISRDKCHFFNLQSSISFLRHSWKKRKCFFEKHLSLIITPTLKHQHFTKLGGKQLFEWIKVLTSLNSLAVLKYSRCFSTKSIYWSLNWSLNWSLSAVMYGVEKADFFLISSTGPNFQLYFPNEGCQ